MALLLERGANPAFACQNGKTPWTLLQEQMSRRDVRTDPYAQEGLWDIHDLLATKKAAAL